MQKYVSHVFICQQNKVITKIIFRIQGFGLLEYRLINIKSNYKKLKTVSRFSFPGVNLLFVYCFLKWKHDRHSQNKHHLTNAKIKDSSALINEKNFCGRSMKYVGKNYDDLIKYQHQQDSDADPYTWKYLKIFD